MKWLPYPFRGKKNDSNQLLTDLRDRFSRFLRVLDRNNQVLKIISDMEEKAGGEYLFDINYIRASLAGIQTEVWDLIEQMVALGGERYAVLREKYYDVEADVDRILPTCRPILPDQYTIPFDALGRKRSCSVGGKNAQLGEMKVELGLPVPEGFAITVSAYHRFVDANNLQSRINKRVATLNVRSYEDLVRVSEEIQDIVNNCPVPDDLVEAITTSFNELKKKCPHQRFSLRSSAIGEDALYSFAGQYRTFLNVRGAHLVERYRAVLAGKFTPQAIYYILSHSLTEADLAMAVGCVAMVDAKASGVVYTRNPVNAEDDCVLVNSIFGLGRYLVDGRLTPDVFCTSRETKLPRYAHVADKPIRLVVRPEGGTVEEQVPASERLKPSLDENHLRQLTGYALQIEKHYASPQDIEWALDHDGNLFLLQTRPLRVVDVPQGDEPDVSDFPVLRTGGTTVCPGAAVGAVYPVASINDLPSVPDNAVLVTHATFPGLITVMGRARAIITEVGGVASHMATLAREYQVPTLSDIKDATMISRGTVVTVDATGGTVYEGAQDRLVAARSARDHLFGDMPIFRLFNDVLRRVSPLNLVQPSGDDFTAANCRTYHDITRYVHQKAMEEMFLYAKDIEYTDEISVRLESDIPLQVNIICMDRDMSKMKSIKDSEIQSVPMAAFWSGVKEEGWPKPAAPTDAKGFMGVMAVTATNSSRQSFSEQSFAILSDEYMLLSLRMGYHFITIEAVCTDDANKNYIRMQYKEGGATLDRRIRRINLLTEVLTKMGFRHNNRGDYLDSTIAYLAADAVRRRLNLLGRLDMLTKQLDMALSSDEVARWYTDDILMKLGLQESSDGRGAADDKEA